MNAAVRTPTTLAFTMSFVISTTLTLPKREAYTCRRVATSDSHPSRLSMRDIRTFFVTVLGVMLTALLATSGSPTVSAQSDERQLIVSVLDRDGAPVAGLGPNDFVVREDGAAREVLRVEAAPDGHQIVLLVDTSQAAGEAVADFRRGLTAFVEAMHEGNEISIISFGGAPRILAETTTSLTQLRDGIGKVFSFSGRAAYLIDAVSETVEGFERREATRPTVVILTTEGLDYSNRDARAVLNRLEESGVGMHVLVLLERERGPGDPSIDGHEVFQRRIERDLLLDLGPKAGGGRRRDLLAGLVTEQKMRELAAELRGQYLVVYARPGALIPPEEIEVRARRVDLTARGRPIRMGVD